MIQTGGVHHLALVCKDMDATVRFYTGVMGMPLTARLTLPGGAKHYFFDMGGGNQLAFFWFPDAPPAQPGVTNAGRRSLVSAHGSMNHLAFSVPDEDALWAAHDELTAKNVPVIFAQDHEFCKSIYFRDPDGMLLELSYWVRSLDERDLDESRPVLATLIQRPVAIPAGF